MKNLVDELLDRGWTAECFNWVGPQPPYVRVGYSLLRQISVFEPMYLFGRLLRPSLRIDCVDLIGRQQFMIRWQSYSEIADARWIEQQDDYPFDEWMQPISVTKTELVARRVSLVGGPFYIAFAAFSVGLGVCLRDPIIGPDGKILFGDDMET
jgi:hypothetical protein